MNKKWIHAAGIRAIKTVAQTFVGAVGTSVFIHEIDFVAVLSAAAIAGLLSLATSIAGIPEAPMETK